MRTVFRRFKNLIYGLLALMVISFGVALVVLNLTTLPKSVRALEGYAIRCYSIALTIERATYLPFRGVVLSKIEIQSKKAVYLDAQIGQLRVRVPAKSILALRSSFQFPKSASDSIIRNFTSFLDTAAQASLLPNEVTLNNTRISHLIVRDQSLSTTVASISVLHDRRSAELLLNVSGIGNTDMVGLASINYASGALSATIETDEYPVKTPMIPSGTLSGRISLYSTFAHRYLIDGNLRLSDAELLLPALSQESIDKLHMQYVFAAYFDPEVAAPSTFLDSPHSNVDAKGALVFTKGNLSLNKLQGDVTPAFRGLIANSEPIPRITQVAVTIPETPIQHIIDSIPSAVSGLLSRSRVDGSVSYQLNLDIPTDEIGDLSWRADAEEKGFAVTAIHSSSNPYKLNGEFVHTIIDDNIDFRRTVRIPRARPASMKWMLEHSEHTYNQIQKSRKTENRKAVTRPPVVVIPDSLHDSPPVDPTYTYVYLEEMSPWVIRSILTAEDGDFFFYGGVNWITLIGAIERNIDAGEILYGASTISMQLAKMLFLDQQRVFSRKLQEVFLVYLMEHHVPLSKDRILELYINLAEFGPGIFGIYDAAWYYFGKSPQSLTAGEAAWIATIMPSPKSYHRHFDNGYISDAWFERMKGLFEIMLVRGRMNDAEYDQAVQSRPEFAERN